MPDGAHVVISEKRTLFFSFQVDVTPFSCLSLQLCCCFQVRRPYYSFFGLQNTLSTVVQACIAAFHDDVQSLDLHYSYVKCRKHLLKLML